MKDMKQVANTKYKESSNTHRGFKEFVNNENGDIINAYFLVAKLHSFLEKQTIQKAFIDILNEGNDGIRFGLIEFKQNEEIVKDKHSFYKTLVECAK